jgi:uncharacterized delta-60 repeat protein
MSQSWETGQAAAKLARVESLESRILFSPGALDPTFGKGGVVGGTLSIFDGGQSHAVALQPDGRIIAAGGSQNDGVLGYRLAPVTSQFALARFMPDGSLDPTFGSGGRVIASLGQTLGTIQAIALQPDGKIVTAGFAGPDTKNTHFAVERFNPDGTPDATFGTDGITVTPFTTTDDATSVALQPDGKIVAAGSATLPDGSSEFVLARYLPAGALDPAFGTAGVVTATLGNDPTLGNSSGAKAIVILKDGRIVAGGEVNSNLTLGCFTASGTLDAHFGQKGAASMVLANLDESTATGLAVERDGKIVVSGSTLFSDQKLLVTRFSSTGHLDRGFGTRGLFQTTFRDSTTDPALAAMDQNGQANAVAIQRDGRIVVVGYLVPEAGHGQDGARIAAIRLTPAGQLDPSFGKNGKVITNTDFTIGGIVVEPEAVVIQSDGRIVAAGTTLSYDPFNPFPEGDASDFMLLRYTRSGNLDRTFSTGIIGPKTTSYSGFLGAMAQQGDGKIVVAGGDPWTLTRFLPDGTLDDSFGVGGHVQPPNDNWENSNIGLHEMPSALVILSDGKILTGGITSISYGPNLLKLAEYNADGSIAKHFGRHGIATLSLDKKAQYPDTELKAMAVQPDGKIVVGATDAVDTGFTLVRFTRGGSLDHSFGRGGIVRTPAFGGSNEDVEKIALDPQGRIVVGGTGPSGLAFARYEPNGKLDAGFGEGGTLITSSAAGVQLLAMSPAAGGSIVSAGLTNDGRLAIAHYDVSGKLDPQFGTGGEIISSDASLTQGVGQAVIQPDGSFLIAAGMIFRYTPTGQLDPAFGTAGVATLPSQSTADVLGLQADGKILIASNATGRLLRLSA